MLFNSLTFLIFFVVFAAAYYLARRRLRLQNALILIGSYIFYGAWDDRFLVLIMASTATDYVCGLGAAGRMPTRRERVVPAAFLAIGSLVVVLPSLEESWWVAAATWGAIAVAAVVLPLIDSLPAERRRAAYLWTSVAVNLGLLGVFKYFNFFADSLEDLAGLAGITMRPITLDVILPVGISFYTFQTMSYTIDIYRRRLEPTHRFLEVAAFVAFFPQLVAGPIERARNLLPQFFERRAPTPDSIVGGATLVLWGLFKKVVIADNLAPIADRAFADPAAMTGPELFAGLLAFTFQIYCDFSGYSDMARGLARMLGFEIMLNFNLPYVARTPSEFWQRWHISLSSWLRDYLYVPLGGNRHGTLLTYRNLMLTMLLGGLWHGANWTFVIWGAYHGAILVVYRLLRVDAWLAENDGFRPLRDATLIAGMFALTMIGWLFFRAQSFSELAAYVGGFVRDPGLLSADLGQVLVYIWPLLAIQALQLYRRELELFPGLPRFARFNVALYAGCGLLFMTPEGVAEFIYFDF